MVLVVLAAACGQRSLRAARSDPLPSARAVLAVTVPSPAQPPSASVAVLAPSPEALAALRASLDAADAQYFAGEFAIAREGYLKAWYAWHPNPLALVMAAHAARRAGDRLEAEELLARARDEAGAAARLRSCADAEGSSVFFDRPDAAWHRSESVWYRLALPEGRALFGFCDQTRDPAEPGVLTWAPSVPEAEWEHPPPGDDGSSATGTRILLRDQMYDDPLGSVPHLVEHIDHNEEYHGQIAFSRDRSLMASAANVDGEGVRLWRVADRTLLHQLPPVGDQWLDLSADGKLLVASTCTRLSVWNGETGAKVCDLPVPGLCCGYGSGIGSPIFGTAFSHDQTNLAVGLMIMSFPGAPLPEDESGVFLMLYRLPDGKLLGKWRDAPMPAAFAPNDAGLIGTWLFSDSLALFDLEGGRSQAIEGRFRAVSPSGRWILEPSGAVLEWQSALAARRLGFNASLEQLGPYLLPRVL
ncbi:MAG: hypothetical protein JW751_29160 [Polyangiaceae bacterium]|nr:hypothetical protein [Polyangiaceae bacterium]